MTLKALRSKALASLFVLALSSLQAAAPKDFSGTWAMQLGQRNLFVLSLTANESGVTGSMEQPKEISLNDKNVFTHIGSEVERNTIVSSRIADGALHITVADASDPTNKNEYVMTLKGDGAELRFADLPAGTSIKPFQLRRTTADAKVATDWDPVQQYVPDEPESSSASKSLENYPAMERLFNYHP
jgi:hypothetical protein